MSKIFISHSSEDEDAACEIVALLTSAGLEPWLDLQEITPGDSFLERMNEGLRDASYVLVLLSSASISSRWVNKEWMAALASGSSILIPLLLETVEVPPLLRDVVYIDFRDRSSGAEQLLSFFRRELSPVGTLEAERPEIRGMAPDILGTLSPRELRLIASACLTNTALDAFLIDAELNPGDIGGSSLNDRINSLLHKVNREGIAVSFAEWLSLEQPNCFERNLVKVRTQRRWTLATN